MPSEKERATAADARRTFATWAAQERGWPDGSTPAEVEAWRLGEWRRLTLAIRSDPETWWSVAVRAIKASTDEMLLGRFDWLPFTAVLLTGGAALQRRAADDARADPRVAAVVFWALDYQATLPEQPWSQEAAVVALLGLDLVVATEVRLLARVHGFEPHDRTAWHSNDFWAHHLGSRLGSLAPELGWDTCAS